MVWHAKYGMVMYEFDIPIKVMVMGNFQKLSDR